MTDNLEGLSSQQAANALTKFGPNKIPDPTSDRTKALIRRLFSPINIMLVVASLLALVSNKIFDFWFILFLAVINFVITVYQENKADTAIQKLNQNLANHTKVLRDQKWQQIPDSQVVPGDVIEVGVGELLPADCDVLRSNNFMLNEASISGESLPVERRNGDKVLSGTAVVTGKAFLKVVATGAGSDMGRIVTQASKTHKRSLLEKDIVRISKFLVTISVIAIVILDLVLIGKSTDITDILELDLSLVIAGIPISLPTVMTLIIEIGVLGLAAKNLLTRRISALQDLANVNLILTDKTGTLTKDIVAVTKTIGYNSNTEAQVLGIAAHAAKVDEMNPINAAVLEAAKKHNAKEDPTQIIQYVPADSIRKRTTVVLSENNQPTVISVGAPQIIREFCKDSKDTLDRFDQEVLSAAETGVRSLGVAIRKGSNEEKEMQLVGIIHLSDTLREDTPAVVDFLRKQAIKVVMVTGDHWAIAKQVAAKLEIAADRVAKREDISKWEAAHEHDLILDQFDVFAEVLPEDKYQLVQKGKQRYVVAATGDGVNDLPALKAATVSIAVNTAVSALKSTADFVLLTNGLGVIRDAILESRRIFMRVYNYSIYRISESFRLIISILILGAVIGSYPLTPLQLILLALLNDIPIISLAFDRVEAPKKPAQIKVARRFVLSSLYGIVGIANSLIFFFLFINILHYDIKIVQTLFFLKLTVSGHLLIYVVRTTKHWFESMPSKQVLIATSLTQMAATIFALTGFMMPAAITLSLALFVWGWAFLWMQIGELVKFGFARFTNN